MRCAGRSKRVEGSKREPRCATRVSVCRASGFVPSTIFPSTAKNTMAPRSRPSPENAAECRWPQRCRFNGATLRATCRRLESEGGADEGDEGSVVVLAPGHGQRRSTEHAVSLSDASNGKSSRLLTTVLTVESQPALTEVVVPSVRRIDLRCRPIESVGFQSRILAVLGAAATEQRLKSRAASGHEQPCMPLCLCPPNPR